MTHDYKTARMMVQQGMRLGRKGEDAILSALDIAMRQKTYVVSKPWKFEGNMPSATVIKNYICKDIADNLKIAALDAMVITEDAQNIVGTLTVVLPPKDG